MATDRPRYTVSVDNDLFQQIEDFRFEHRFQTRSEATVELIRLDASGNVLNRKPLVHLSQEESGCAPEEPGGVLGRLCGGDLRHLQADRL